ncbi:MAG: aminotransferase class V-fold PLP-dependent enzyme, partial [Planctomycetaceae bacterium]|nr:aminotransferase class V-fold PLP-dependent enzyme [Planctomycetaceae bacterium]
MQPVYLDHAATSAPKSAAVIARVEQYLKEEAISIGRGGYRRAIQLEQEITQGRSRLARLLGAESSREIIFTGSGTAALNQVLFGLQLRGGHVVRTALEHNSVLRPLAELERKGKISCTVIPPEQNGQIDPDRFRAAFRPETVLACCVQASNVTGLLQPVKPICRAARERGIATLIDASQAVGHIPVNVQEIGCDFLAAPCHKGLRALTGTGFLYLRSGRETRLEPRLFGGTGHQSELKYQPEEMPDRFESGTHNVPGLLSLCAALSNEEDKLILREAEQTAGLLKQLLTQLERLPNLAVIHPKAPLQERIGVVSFQIPGQDPRMIAAILDEYGQIEVRAGLHCSPETHQVLGTFQQGGTVRVSM